MPNPAIWYPDPPPAPRRPTAPVPAQGDQPPRAMRSLVALGSLVAAWQPPDPPPVIPQRQYVAPLTLRYGDPPPVASGLRDPDLLYEQASSAWQPPDPQPQRPVPTQVVSADQPPRYSILPVAEARLIWEPPPPEPRQLPRTVAPLTLPTGQQPPGARPAVPPAQPLWPTGLESAPPRPAPSAVVAPVVLTQVPTARPPDATRAAWEPAWVAPPVPRAVTPAFPAATQPPPSSPAGRYAALELWRPPPAEAQRPPLYAPLTLPTGQRPPAPGRAWLLAVAAAWRESVPVGPKGSWLIPAAGAFRPRSRPQRIVGGGVL